MGAFGGGNTVDMCVFQSMLALSKGRAYTTDQGNQSSGQELEKPLSVSGVNWWKLISLIVVLSRLYS